MLPSNEDCFLTWAAFLQIDDLRELRRATRQVDEVLRRTVNLTVALAVREARNPADERLSIEGFAVLSCDRLLAISPKFNFKGLRLLNIPLLNVVGLANHAGIDESETQISLHLLRSLLDEVLSLRVVFEGGEFIGAPSAAEAVEKVHGWRECDRWRVGVTDFDPFSRNLNYPRRVVNTHFDSGADAAPDSSEWIQKIYIGSSDDSNFDEEESVLPGGVFSTLRVIETHDPWPGLANWFANIEAPLLTEIRAVVWVNYLRFRICSERFWMTKDVTIGLDPSPTSAKLLGIVEKRANRKASLDHLTIKTWREQDWPTAVGWLAERENWWIDITVLHWEGGIASSIFKGSSITGTSWLMFRHLREFSLGHLREEAVRAWKELLSRARMPSLTSFSFDRAYHRSHESAIEVLRLPLFATIRELDLGDSFFDSFNLPSLIVLPNLAVLKFRLRDHFLNDNIVHSLSAPTTEVDCTLFPSRVMHQIGFDRERIHTIICRMFPDAQVRLH